MITLSFMFGKQISVIKGLFYILAQVGIDTLSIHDIALFNLLWYTFGDAPNGCYGALISSSANIIVLAACLLSSKVFFHHVT